MMIDIYMTFREDSLKRFQVIERTGLRKITKKSIKARVMILALCTSSNVD